MGRRRCCNSVNPKSLDPPHPAESRRDSRRQTGFVRVIRTRGLPCDLRRTRQRADSAQLMLPRDSEIAFTGHWTSSSKMRVVHGVWANAAALCSLLDDFGDRFGCACSGLVRTRRRHRALHRHSEPARHSGRDQRPRRGPTPWSRATGVWRGPATCRSPSSAARRSVRTRSMSRATGTFRATAARRRAAATRPSRPTLEPNPGNRSRATGRRRRTCRRPPASSIRQPIIDQTSSCLTTTDGAIVPEIVPRGHRGYPETDVKTKI